MPLAVYCGSFCVDSFSSLHSFSYLVLCSFRTIFVNLFLTSTPFPGTPVYIVLSLLLLYAFVIGLLSLLFSRLPASSSVRLFASPLVLLFFPLSFAILRRFLLSSYTFSFLPLVAVFVRLPSPSHLQLLSCRFAYILLLPGCPSIPSSVVFYISVYTYLTFFHPSRFSRNFCSYCFFSLY